LEFALGSSLAKVCEYCRHTVVRSDRGLENLGKVADLALTPALIAIGDEGTLSGRPFRVFGRVQLDHGQGPWDEYFVAFDQGQNFGWLAYAQGNWYVTSLVPGVPAPAYNELALEGDVQLANVTYRVAEIKSGRVTSSEGELPEPVRVGQTRLYADLSGPKNAFATLDYGEGRGPVSVFLGWVFSEPELRVNALGPRSTQKVKSTTIRCPNCGGDVPKLMGDRAERVGCPYCGAVSDIAEQRVISVQERARAMPDIPLGQHGTFEGLDYTCIAYMRRGTSFEGEPYSWEEYLLWCEPVGFRWLVKDPETGWTWVVPTNLADIEHQGRGLLRWGPRTFRQRSETVARVEYVLGELNWKCEVGEATRVADFVDGHDVLSREEGNGEVRYSFSSPIPWPVLAHGFGLPNGGGGASFGGGDDFGGTSGPGRQRNVALILIFALIILVAAAQSCGSCAGGGGSGSSYRGTGVYYGGK